MTERRPSGRLLLIWILYAMLSAGLFVIASVLLFYMDSVPFWMARAFTGLWAILLLVICTLYLPLRFRHISFRLDENRLFTRSGAFYLSEKALPLDSIRYITLLYSPLERVFRICSLVIFTAGGVLLLEGLPIDEARSLQRQLLIPSAETEGRDG